MTPTARLHLQGGGGIFQQRGTLTLWHSRISYCVAGGNNAVRVPISPHLCCRVAKYVLSFSLTYKYHVELLKLTVAFCNSLQGGGGINCQQPALLQLYYSRLEQNRVYGDANGNVSAKPPSPLKGYTKREK